jgi:hypothetical protein
VTEHQKPDQSPLRGTHAAGAADQARDLPISAGATAAASDLPAEIHDVQEFLPLAIPETQRRGVGRPANSPNIRTNRTFQAAISRYGDPLAATIAFGNMSTRELIKELRSIASDAGLKLGATVMDVLRFQEECRRNAMPFGHAKRAPVNEVGETVPPVLGLGTVQVSAQGDVHVHGASIEDEIERRTKTIEHEPNQQVSDGQNAKSQPEKSHDDATR